MLVPHKVYNRRLHSPSRNLDLPLEDSPYLLDEHGPIFILGCPRSGTSFLSHFLGALPDVEEFVGELAPPRLMHLVAQLPDDMVRNELMSAIRDIFWLSLVSRRHRRDLRLGQLYSRSITLREFLAKPSLGDALFCYKEPFLCFAWEAFASQFPNAKFIHIVRDGRDNADSMDRTYPHALSDEVLKSRELSRNKTSEIGRWREWNGFNIPWWIEEGSEGDFAGATRFERYLMLWREMTSRALRLSALGSSRYLEIRYEHLASTPLEAGQRIAAFVGRSLTPRARARLRSAVPTSIAISNSRKSPEDLAAAIKVAGPLLFELGYK